MPVGAIIGGAASIGGALLGGKSQKKAAKTAAAADLRAAEMNNALQREVYAKNEAWLSPYAERGNVAGNAMQGLLGLDGVAAGTANPAFQNYLNSTGYQFQVDQGNKAINQGYAARGALQSGAALKALQSHGQNTATGFFKDYLGLLANQQGVGLSGASAIAGVGQGYANSVGANNVRAADSRGTAALIAGNANANMYGTIGNALGNVASGAFGSSYGGSNNNYNALVADNRARLPYSGGMYSMPDYYPNGIT